ncbi:MAG: aminotransferase class I/II-fold pyridoxal phosphate-dependent enzyme [Bacteroidetes bacterium]|nr:MAG: aminotransferase class I/II-fold pyridoxal phosphate-dependent enzyme [Bacteroidota bacterium]
MSTPRVFDKLSERKQAGNYRQLKDYSTYIDFISNDYLGISKILGEGVASLQGSTGSRLLSGQHQEVHELELFLADFFEAEAALVFHSGYDANVGLMSALSQRDTTILYDEYIHASVRDGIRMGSGKSYSFRHNDLGSLKEKLKHAGSGDVFVVVESLYSMQGDLAPLEDLLLFCEREGLFLIVDEAHSGGLFGEKGKGLLCELEMQKRVFARLITFGKAFGSTGAVVLGSEELRNYLINFARSFIYTTAISSGQCLSIRRAVEEASINTKRELLSENIQYFRNMMGIEGRSRSPIQMLRVTDLSRAQGQEQALWKAGIACKLIQAPSIERGQEAFRICLHAYNSREEIDKLCQILNSGKG